MKLILQDASKTLRALKHERDELALVIMGGEDAPGLAASLSLKELQTLQLDNQASVKAFHEYDLSQAITTARAEALEEAVTWLKDQDWNGHELQGTDYLAQEMESALITPPKETE